MKKLFSSLAGLIFALAALFAAPAFATNCPANPFTLTNSQAADATQVMANFNSIITCLNLNMAPVANPTFTGTVTIPTLSVTGATTLAGGVSGNLNVSGTGSFSGGIAAVSGAAGTFRDFTLATSNVARWAIQVQNDAENPGTNTGSTLCIARFADAGGSIDCPMQVNRATGLTTFFDGVAVGNGFTVNAGGFIVSAGGASITGGLTVSGAVSLPAGSIVNADLANMAANTLKGNNTGSAAAPSDLTVSQVASMLGLASSAGSPGYFVIPGTGGSIYVEWGLYDCGSSQCWNSTNAVSVTLPLTCPNGALGGAATGYNPAGIAAPRTPTITSLTASTLTVTGNGASDEGFYWVEVCH